MANRTERDVDERSLRCLKSITKSTTSARAKYVYFLVTEEMHVNKMWIMKSSRYFNMALKWRKGIYISSHDENTWMMRIKEFAFFLNVLYITVYVQGIADDELQFHIYDCWLCKCDGVHLKSVDYLWIILLKILVPFLFALSRDYWFGRDNSSVKILYDNLLGLQGIIRRSK